MCPPNRNRSQCLFIRTWLLLAAAGASSKHIIQGGAPPTEIVATVYQLVPCCCWLLLGVVANNNYIIQGGCPPDRNRSQCLSLVLLDAAGCCWMLLDAAACFWNLLVSAASYGMRKNVVLCCTLLLALRLRHIGSVRPSSCTIPIGPADR